MASDEQPAYPIVLTITVTPGETTGHTECLTVTRPDGCDIGRCNQILAAAAEHPTHSPPA